MRNETLRWPNQPAAPSQSTEVNPQLGSLLRAYRVRRALTQQLLAHLSGVSERAIGDIERGTVERPRRDTVRLLARALRLTGEARVAFEAAAGQGGVTRDLAQAWDELPGPPAALDGLVGRTSEVAALLSMLAAGAQRLVSITGLAGVGKTRLALEVAGELHTGHGVPVLWTSPPGDSQPHLDPDLSSHHPHLASVALDELLAAPGAADERLASAIGERRLLLVLDGCELAGHQLSRVVSLLWECAELRVLVTRREPAGHQSERTVPLGPLALPSEGDLSAGELESVPSVRLFVRLVQQVRPGFVMTTANRGAVAALCQRVDGIPAALAALAPWFLVFEPAALLPRLTADPFGLIEDAGQRVSDLRQLLCRAIDSLEPAERQLLGLLADVESSWSPGTATELAGGAAAEGGLLVQRLLQHGLIRPDGDPQHRRFVVLELVRWLHRAQAPAEATR